jgi:uncharacterized RDD family membrane protein YckC
MAKANVGTRLIALVIDTIIVWFFGVIVGLVLGEEILGIGIGFIIGIAYNGYFWSQRAGQTPGKGMMGIRVVSTDGSGVSVIQAVVRYIGYYISTLLLFLGWIWAIFDRDTQTLHDKLAGTYVVRA